MTDTTNAANSSPIAAECAANSSGDDAMHFCVPCKDTHPLGQHTHPGVANFAAKLAVPQPQGGALTDEQIMQAMEAAGVKFQAVFQPRLKADKVTTCGSIDAVKIIAGARAVLAQSAPSAPQQAGDGLTDEQRDRCSAALRNAEINGLTLVSVMRHDLRCLLAAPRQPGEMGAGVHCRTCNDNGMIGGPTFYAPDEGGDPCPDCSCFLCNGSGVVPDGEITGVGGVEFSNGPIACVKDCPLCADDRRGAASAQQDKVYYGGSKEPEPVNFDALPCPDNCANVGQCDGSCQCPEPAASAQQDEREAFEAQWNAFIHSGEHESDAYLMGWKVWQVASRAAMRQDCGAPIAWVDEKAEALVFGGWDKRPFSNRYKPVFYGAAQQVQADAGAVALTDSQIDAVHDEAAEDLAASYGLHVQDARLDTRKQPTWRRAFARAILAARPSPAGESDKRERFERFERIKRLALDAGGQGALPVPASLSKIVRECLDGIAAMSREQSGDDRG